MRIIETTSALADLVQELKSAPYIALDTEFMRDSTYWPKLCLLQIAAPGIEAIVDPLADGLDLSCFFELLTIKDIVKVLHAGRQDIEIFWDLGHVVPDPLFDTQIAGMVCGFGEAASYETMARKLAGVQLDKSARFTDWSRRPLSPRQQKYALADVTHLRVIYEKLSAQLKETGRFDWVAEEMHALQNPELYQLEPENAWKRLKPRSANKRYLSTLVAVAAWRESEAQTRNIPRGRVLKDEVLLEMASNPPATTQAMEQIRSVPKGFGASRMAKALLTAIEEGKDAPPPEVDPMLFRGRNKPHPAAANIDLFKTLLRLRAEQFDVAPRLIADSSDVERIATGEDDGVPAMSGWRATVFGKDAVALREGRLAIVIKGGKATVIPTPEG